MGELSMKINGNDWAGVVRTGVYSNRLRTVDDKYKKVEKNLSIPWEIFSLQLVDKTINNQRIYMQDSLAYIQPEISKTYVSYGTVQDDGDVVCDLFDVAEADSVNNWIQITKEKNGYKEIWGMFSVTLYRVEGCATSSYPDTLKIRDGNFHIYFDK